jgi:prepilin-type N-terminal cleavage/methylation domain-containing protein
MKIQMDLKQRGISLLEVMLSLAIIAIILVMATRYFGIASRSSNLNTATGQVNEIRQGVAQYVNSTGNLPASLDDLYNRGFITQQTSTKETPWAGTSIDLTGGGAGGVLSVTIYGAWGTTNCQNMASRFGIDSGAQCTGTTFTIPALVQQ